MEMDNFTAIKDITSKLMFISRIGEKEKVNTKSLRIQQEGWMTTISRTLEGENREDTYNFVDETIKRAFSLIRHYSTSRNEVGLRLCADLYKALENIPKGLDSLSKTYRDDKMFVCKLEALNQTLKANLLIFQRLNDAVDESEQEKNPFTD